MKNIILGFLILFTISIVKAQEVNNNMRYIEITGSAEMEIDPDEIRFQIGIEEYWFARQKNFS